LGSGVCAATDHDKQKIAMRVGYLMGFRLSRFRLAGTNVRRREGLWGGVAQQPGLPPKSGFDSRRRVRGEW
jgi:hypothetical protein